MNGLLGPVTANPRMLAQAVNARNKPEFQMKPNTPQGLLDAAALAMSPVPIAGDAVGLLADGHRFVTQPETRTPLNFGLAALGLIPFLPPLVNMGLSQAAKARGLPSASLPTGPGRNQAGAIVYHGSPHKFDKFDSSKIGTGEGAQAYGHGLYFAEQPSVAKNYLPKPQVVYNVPQLEGKSAVMVGNEIVSTHDTAEAANKALGKVKAGSLYKVDLPDEAIAKMLDWDKPLSQQAPEVQKAIFDKYPEYSKGLMPSLKGSDFYSRISGIDAIPDRSKSVGATQALKNLGVPGIRYLDGGSRSTGEGTRNFVVFPGNEGLLKIIERQ